MIVTIIWSDIQIILWFLKHTNFFLKGEASRLSAFSPVAILRHYIWKKVYFSRKTKSTLKLTFLTVFAMVLSRTIGGCLHFCNNVNYRFVLSKSEQFVTREHFSDRKLLWASNRLIIVNPFWCSVVFPNARAPKLWRRLGGLLTTARQNSRKHCRHPFGPPVQNLPTSPGRFVC